MAVDLEVAFSTHQTIYVVFGLLFIVVFLIQICVEGNLSEPMSHQNIKWQLHRLGLFATLLFLVYSLDPYTANGLYTPVIVYLLSVNISSTIISALTVVNHASTAVVYKSQFRPTPAWFTAFSWIAGLGTFVVGNIVGITADRKSAGWITAVFMLWMALIVSLLVIIMVRSHTVIFKNIYKANKHGKRASVSDIKRAQQHQVMKIKLVVISVLAAVFVPVQVYYGSLLFRDKKSPFPGPNLDHYDFIHNQAMALGQMGAIFLIFVYGRVDFAFTKQKSESLSTTASRNSISSGSRPRKSARERAFSHMHVSASRNSVSAVRTESSSERLVAPPV